MRQAKRTRRNWRRVHRSQWILCLLFIWATSVSCNSSNDSEKTQVKEEKIGAPVDVKATLEKNTAKLAISFEQDARDVKVKVWGTEGLVVMSEGWPVDGADMAKGKSLNLLVEYSAPKNQCDLAVGVTGIFGGKALTRVQTFKVNKDGPLPNKKTGESQVDEEGQPVQVIPSK